MCEAFAHMQNLNGLKVFSAGSAPSGIINQKAIATMNELGYDLKTHHTKLLEEVKQFSPFDVVVTMGCGDSCPWMPARQFVDWNIPDPRNMSPEEFRKVRYLLGIKVKELLSGL